MFRRAQTSYVHTLALGADACGKVPPQLDSTSYEDYQQLRCPPASRLYHWNEKQNSAHKQAAVCTRFLNKTSDWQAWFPETHQALDSDIFQFKPYKRALQKTATYDLSTRSSE